MPQSATFDLRDFTPYLLNLAAEASSLKFQAVYKERYGMLRTEWRVVFHLGRYGPMHAKEICDRARIHKTKVSRAVSALERKRFLTRRVEDDDKRHARLSLTAKGTQVFHDLFETAQRFDADLTSRFTEAERATLRKCLIALADLTDAEDAGLPNA